MPQGLRFRFPPHSHTLLLHNTTQTHNPTRTSNIASDNPSLFQLQLYQLQINPSPPSQQQQQQEAHQASHQSPPYHSSSPKPQNQQPKQWVAAATTVPTTPRRAPTTPAVAATTKLLTPHHPPPPPRHGTIITTGIAKTAFFILHSVPFQLPTKPNHHKPPTSKSTSPPSGKSISDGVQSISGSNSNFPSFHFLFSAHHHHQQRNLPAARQTNPPAFYSMA